VGKLVIFELGEGNFEHGFPVKLQIGEEGKNPSVEIRGKLPPDSNILRNYQDWHSAYLSLETLYRASKKQEQLNSEYRLSKKPQQKTRGSFLEDCNLAAGVLRDNLNNWLNSDELRLLREKLIQKVSASDEMRLLVKTDDVQMQRLPWHLWNLLEPYNKTEVAVIPTVFETVGQIFPKPKIRILAILGDSTGINTQADADLLKKQLLGADVKFLEEPKRQELTEYLWAEQGWDILFYAGHSSSEINGENGWIKINEHDCLTIKELKQSLKKAVENGLKLAIFNSCDGLGLAHSLAELSIPQIIVMREPVPDKVAQTFLKYFLEAFYRGESLYCAVKEARGKLEGLENEFPCATWLPVIYQNSPEAPPSWKDWLEKSKDWVQNQRRRLKLRAVFAASLAVTSLVVGVRSLGMLQPLELEAFDQMLRLRPEGGEGLDPRLLIVRVTDEDLQTLKQGFVYDETLLQALKKLEQYKPAVIGLDLYRDLPQPPGTQELQKYFQQSDSTIAICGYPNEQGTGGYPVPPGIRNEHVGFNDLATGKEDKIVRRQILSMNLRPQNICPTEYAFSFLLAAKFLSDKGYAIKLNSQQEWQIGSVIFKRLRRYNGGYQQFNDKGYQILLNYRQPLYAGFSVTITDILYNRVNRKSIEGRIILIGADDNGDRHLTPYGEDIPGVAVNAQMTSQIISAVEDGRKLLSVWPFWSDVVWIFAWSLAGGMLAWRCNSIPRLLIGVTTVLIILAGVCFTLILTEVVWVPLLPSAIALVMTSAGLVIYVSFQAKQYQNQASPIAILSA
jgi:CHASE2 domain-containing sensor protein